MILFQEHLFLQTLQYPQQEIPGLLHKFQTTKKNIKTTAICNLNKRRNNCINHIGAITSLFIEHSAFMTTIKIKLHKFAVFLKKQNKKPNFVVWIPVHFPNKTKVLLLLLLTPTDLF